MPYEVDFLPAGRTPEIPDCEDLCLTRLKKDPRLGIHILEFYTFDQVNSGKMLHKPFARAIMNEPLAMALAQKILLSIGMEKLAAWLPKYRPWWSEE